MSKILSIETSSAVATAALLIDQTLIQREAHGVTTHSQSILPMVQSLLHEAGISLSECDAIAFGSGPGSFTGVRTACGVVQGLAFGADLPVIPIITLLALADACRSSAGATNVLTALDARMGEVYWAQYRYDPEQQVWVTLVEPTLSAPALVVAQEGNDLTLAGNGFLAYSDKFTLSPDLLAAAQSTVPEAGAIARLAQVEWVAGRIIPAERAQPLYLRNKIALTTAERLDLAAAGRK